VTFETHTLWSEANSPIQGRPLSRHKKAWKGSFISAGQRVSACSRSLARTGPFEPVSQQHGITLAHRHVQC
jgi:hypothetical protein